MSYRTEREKELYQSIKTKLRKDMKDVVTNLIHKTRESLEQDTVDADYIVNEVSKVVSTSDAYKTLKRSLVMGIVNDRSQNTTSEDRLVDREDCISNNLASLNSPHLSSSQCSYVILGTKDLQVATKLLQSPLLQDKLHSLNILRQTSSLEQFVCPQVWPALQFALKEGLRHPVATVGEFCLDIYINMMVSSSPTVVKEGYNGLLEFLSSCRAKDLDAASRNYKNFMQTSHSKIFMQTVCIINKFEQCISKHWLRYPQNIMEEIIKNTFKHFALSFNQSCKPTITNFWTIMTIVDTDNIWLRNWLHERLSRKFVVSAIHEYPQVIEGILENVNRFANQIVTGICNHQNCSEFSLYEVSWSVCFLSRLLHYSEGRNLIFVIQGSDNNNIYNTWNNITKCILMLCHTSLKFYKYNTDFASQAIYCLWVNLISRWDAEDRSKILQVLLLPFEYCKADNSSCYMFMINESTKLISAISVLDTARTDLSNLKLDKKFQKVVDWLTNGSSSESVGTHNLCNEILINMVRICRNMLSSPFGIISGRNIVLTLGLIQSFQTCWSRQSDCETPVPYQKSANRNEISKLNCLHEEISKSMLVLLSSPLGTSLLCEANCLLESIDYMIESYSGLYENSTAGLKCSCSSKCFAWLYLYSGNVEAIQKSKLLLLFPKKIWQNMFYIQDSSIDQQLKYASITNKMKSLLFLYPTANALYNEILHKVDIADVQKMWKSICLVPLANIFLTMDDLNYIGSSILCSLVCNVKMLLYLEQKLCIRAFLLKLLRGHILHGSIIIDEISILWNHILVRLFVMGGPKERKLPPKCIKNVTENYNWPFVSQESVNEDYWQFETNTELDDVVLPFIQQKGHHSQIDSYQKTVITLIRNNELTVSWKHLGALLEEVVSMLPVVDIGLNATCVSVANLSDNENIGMKLALQYGINLGLFDHLEDAMDELKYTLQNSKVTINGITYTEEFDVFVATVFLLLKGDGHKTCKLIESYICTHSSLYNWLLPLQASLRCKKLQYLHAILSQYFEVIMSDSLPKVFSAFQICGLSPSVVLWHWTNQCFWNYLNWTEICQWVLLTVIFGEGTILYFAVAVMKHLEQDILIHTQTLTLLDYLKETSLAGFQICDHVDFILKLSEHFSHQIECSVKELLTR